jgi:hypothetical protein
VARRLQSGEWRRLEEGATGRGGGAVGVPVAAGFSVTMRVVPRIVSTEDGTPELAVAGVVGLDYTPAREMTIALTGRAYSGVVLKEPSRVIHVQEFDLDRAVTDLEWFASTQRELRVDDAQLDVVIGMLSRGVAAASTEPTVFLDEATDDGPDPVRDDERHAVLATLLAAAGRYDEARRVLSSIATPSRNDDHTRARYVRQLSRWIDSAGTLRPPSSPPQWGTRPILTGRFDRKDKRRLQDDINAEREALNAVRRVSRGKNRDELRSLLESEYRLRGLHTAPSRIERNADTLFAEQTSRGTLHVALRGLRALAAFGTEARAAGGGLERALAGASRKETQELTEHLRLPARATYPIYASRESTLAVTIDSDGRSVVDAILDTLGPSAEGDIWIDVALTPSVSAGGIDVNVGDRRIGQLDRAQADYFAPAMSAAAERDEVPWTQAWLARRADLTPVLRLGSPTETRDGAT